MANNVEATSWGLRGLYGVIYGIMEKNVGTTI